MKKYLLAILSVFGFVFTINGQTFFDDFESYEVGAYLAASSSDWITWSGNNNNDEDVKITDAAAYSGTNSIKFEALTSNGPTDIVKVYTGEKISSGVMSTKMAMLVETSAHFYFQGEATLGTLTSMSAVFDEDGKCQIRTGDELVLSFDYPQDEWIIWELLVNFDANTWQLNLNGMCMGSFKNDKNSLASVNIFPVLGDVFYLDDFGFDYEGQSALIERDVDVSLRSNLTTALAGVQAVLSGTFRNVGSEIVTSIAADIVSNDETEQIALDGIALERGDEVAFTTNNVYKLSAGKSDVMVVITSINDGTFDDENLCNDSATVELYGVVASEAKKVIIEEGTGTWCGACPRGAVALERFSHNYPDTYIAVAVHISDPMELQEYDSALNFDYYPSSKVNRVVTINPALTEGPFLKQIEEPSAVSILTGGEFDVDTRLLKISLKIKALEMITSGHRIGLVLTEDGVTGTTPDYDQANFFSGSQDLIDIHGRNYRDLPDPVPAADMVYDHVARAMLAPFEGMQNSFPSGIAVGDHNILNFTYTVPEDFNIDKMKIISMLINPDGTINTGEADSIEESIENGWVEIGSVSTYEESLNDIVNVYPNPVVDYVNVKVNLSTKSDVSLNLIDITGKSIMSKLYNNQNGLFSTIINTQSVAEGNYILKITAGENFTTKKLMIIR